MGEEEGMMAQRRIEEKKNLCPRCGHPGDNMDQGGFCNTLMEDFDGTGTDCPCKCYNWRKAKKLAQERISTLEAGTWPGLMQNIQVGTLDVEDKLSILGTQNLIWAGGPTTFSEGDSGLNCGLSSHHREDCELAAILDLLMGTGRVDQAEVEALVEKVNKLNGEWCEFCGCNTNHHKTKSSLKYFFRATMTAIELLEMKRDIISGRLHVSLEVQESMSRELMALGSYESALATFKRLGILD